MSATTATGVTTPPVPDRLDRLTSSVVSGAVPGGTTTTVLTPFTATPLVELPVSAASDVTTAYERARAAQTSWAALPPVQRAAPFLRFHDVVLDRREEILDIIQLETGKARR